MKTDMKLTDENLLSLGQTIKPETQVFFRKSGADHLALRVMKRKDGSIKRDFVWDGRAGERTHRKTLGEVPGMTLAEARIAAASYKPALGSPAPSTVSTTEPGTPTYKSVRDAWLAGGASRWKPLTASQMTAWSSKVPAEWMAKPIADFTREFIQPVYDAKATASPASAKNFKSALFQIFDHAKRTKKYSGENPMTTDPRGDVYGLLAHKLEPRVMKLTREQVASVDKAIEAARVKYPVLGAYVHLCRLQAFRKTELLQMKWSSVNLEARTGWLPARDRKNDKPLQIALRRKTVEILSALPSRGKSDYLFPDKTLTKPMKELHSSWIQIHICEPAGVAPGEFWLHGCRKLVVRELSDLGISIRVAAGILGDSIAVVSKWYADVAAVEEQAEAMDRLDV